MKIARPRPFIILMAVFLALHFLGTASAYLECRDFAVGMLVNIYLMLFR